MQKKNEPRTCRNNEPGKVQILHSGNDLLRALPWTKDDIGCLVNKKTSKILTSL